MAVSVARCVDAHAMSFSSTVVHALSRLQDGLNTMIDASWRRSRSLDDWSLAITMEAAELIDSYPWKWWKAVGRVTDFANVKIELADLLHFALSGTMQRDACGEVSPSIKSRLSQPCVAFTPSDATCAVDDSSRSACGSARDVHPFVFCPLTNTANAVASFRNVVQLAQLYRFDTIVNCLIFAARDLDFNLVAYYVAKHTLNYIRQLGGYKQGTYVKVNAGVEDNVMLHSCIADVTVDAATDETRYIEVWDAIAHRVYDAFCIPSEERKNMHYWMAHGHDV